MYIDEHPNASCREISYATGVHYATAAAWRKAHKPQHTEWVRLELPYAFDKMLGRIAQTNGLDRTDRLQETLALAVILDHLRNRDVAVIDRCPRCGRKTVTQHSPASS